MHLGKRYLLKEYILWTQWEIYYLLAWSTAVTALLALTHWTFLSVPAPLLTIMGLAVAIVLAFKNAQCHARINEALAFSAQLNTNSGIFTNKLLATVGTLEQAEAAPLVKAMFYRHFGWLTGLRFFLRQSRVWENLHERGNKKFLEALPTPESKSDPKEELKPYFSEAEYQRVVAHRGDREAFILHLQY
ncbi:MAG TPA: hypothetical protein VMF53_08195 [Alphaproteobacteria bacterium]|nr:hypothetical protein [Alphaproteobacteria bacterium]